MKVGLGIDAGGTTTKLVLATATGRVLRRQEMPTHADRGGAHYIKRLAASVKRLEKNSARPDAACLAFAGEVDSTRGALRRSPNLSKLERYPLRDKLAATLGRPVTMHNDGDIAAWGVYALELKRRFANVVVLTLGTGVGGGAVIGGRLLVGATGSAAEFGHMRVRSDGALCGCGAQGCLEAYVGVAGILRTAVEVRREHAKARYSLRGLSPKKLSQAALRGDVGAKEVWKRVADSLACGIISLTYSFNPDVLVLAGGVSKAGSLLITPIKRRLRAESFRTPFNHLQLKSAKRPDLGALGAALFALDRE
jgi:glucokinase